MKIFSGPKVLRCNNFTDQNNDLVDVVPFIKIPFSASIANFLLVREFVQFTKLFKFVFIHAFVSLYE